MKTLCARIGGIGGPVAELSEDGSRSLYGPGYKHSGDFTVFTIPDAPPEYEAAFIHWCRENTFAAWPS